MFGISEISGKFRTFGILRLFDVSGISGIFDVSGISGKSGILQFVETFRFRKKSENLKYLPNQEYVEYFKYRKWLEHLKHLEHSE